MDLVDGISWPLNPGLKETFQLRVLLHQVPRRKSGVVVVHFQAEVTSGCAGFPASDVKHTVHRIALMASMFQRQGDAGEVGQEPRVLALDLGPTGLEF